MGNGRAAAPWRAAGHGTPRGHQAFDRSGLPVGDGELGRGQVADEQFFPRGHRRGREGEDDGAVWPVFSRHDLADPGSDAAWAQKSVIVGSLAEDAFLDEHGEPGLAQGLLQARDVLAVLDVSALVPAHVDRAVGVGVHAERGRPDVNRAGSATRFCLGRPQLSPWLQGRSAQRDADGDSYDGPDRQHTGRDDTQSRASGGPPPRAPMESAARAVTTLTSSASSRSSKPPGGDRISLPFTT